MLRTPQGYISSEDPTDEMGNVEHHPTTSVEPPDTLDGVNVSKQVEAMDDEVMRKSWEDIVVMDNVDKEECQQDTPIEPLDKVSSASNLPTAQNIKPSGKSISS